MNLFSKTIRLLADLFMLFLLIGSVGNVWLLTRPNPIVPEGPDDLGAVQLTVRSLDQPVPHGQYILQPKEYPTKFLLSTDPTNPQDVGALVRIGDRVSVEIKKETISKLQNIGLVYAYQLALNDGTVVFDTSKYIPRRTSMTSFDLGNSIMYGMIAIPVLYFLVRGCFYVRRHSPSKQALNL